MGDLSMASPAILDLIGQAPRASLEVMGIKNNERGCWNPGGRSARDPRWPLEMCPTLQGRSATIFNKSMLVMMPTGSFPCVTINR